MVEPPKWVTINYSLKHTSTQNVEFRRTSPISGALKPSSWQLTRPHKKAQYKKLLRENITKHYSSADEDAYEEINVKAQVIASKFGIADRMDMMAKREAFITLKGHKDNFENSLLCRLIKS